jgi:uncharacterized protein YndB with AHSA1/START domain
VVEFTRSFSAPVEVVYRAFTDTEKVARWGIGQRYENIALDMDPRPGGVIYHRVKSTSDGSEWTFFGVYQAVEQNALLTYTFDWKTDWREPPTPSLVELRFHDRGGATEIELRHSQLVEAEVESTESHWTEFLDLLEEMLASKELS